jgi:hypothetical protein
MPLFDRLARTSPRTRFVALLAAFLSLLLVRTEAGRNGDFVEYSVMTVAIAAHGTPAITADDARAAAALAPEFAAPFDTLARGIAAGAANPANGFYRGRGGATYSFHFFAYAALAAAPMRALAALGAPPLKCFQVVNLACIFGFGLCCLRLFGSASRAALGVALYFVCGAALYWNWSSPELMSATGLLCGLILFVTGAPLRAGLLVGVAALQNPSIALACAFAPLFQLAVARAAGLPWRAAAAGLLRARALAGLSLMAGGLLVPVLFNEWQYGVPSIIALAATDVHLVGLVRLRSFFLDLNQGMVVGMPGLFAYLAYTAARRRPPGARMLLLVALALALALAVPTLSTGNWNSGAAGIMRYAFWGAMPLLFAALMALRADARLAALPVALLLATQFASSWEARRYAHTEFSPAARLALAHAPRWYNPVAEIFVERLTGREVLLDPARSYAYVVDGVAVKTLFRPAQSGADARLCGAGRVASGRNDVAAVDAGWAYVNGPVLCEAAATARRD